jgi:hypothetical protein
MAFTPLSKEALSQFNLNKVKRCYLVAVGSMLLTLFKVVVSYVDGMTIRIDGSKEIIIKAMEYFKAHYLPMMKFDDYSEKSPSYFTITRNVIVSHDGEAKSSRESNQVIRDRKRHSAGLCEWTPTGAMLTKSSDPNCPPDKTWKITSRSGKVLGYCRVLNAEGWGFVANFDKNGNEIK